MAFLQSLFEILTSEKSYLVGMQLLVEHFMKNEDLKNAINLVDPVAHNHLFSNANLIAEASDRYKAYY